MRKIVFLLTLFIVGTILGQNNNVKVDLSTPQSTVRTHLHFLNPKTYNPEKSATAIQGYQEKEAKSLAIKINDILKGRGLYIVLSKIPNNPNFSDTINNEPVNRYILFPNRMPKIYVEKVGDKWYYSKETLSQIDELYDEVFPWYAQKIQHFLPKFGNKNFWGIPAWKYIGLILLLVVAFLLFFVFNKIIYLLLTKVQKTTSNIINISTTIVLKKIARPISLLVIIALLKSIIPILDFGIQFNSSVFLVLNLLTIFFIIYILLRITDFFILVYSNYTQKTDSKLDDQLLPILKNISRIVIIFMGLLKILAFLGVDPIKIMTGLSIGGLAVALASQDTVKNFIGTIMIFVDKPFQIGDFIIAGDVEGTVERVGFRSTIVRAPDTSVFQITNSKLSELTVKNRGLLKYRRYKTELGLRYDTPPELVDSFVKGVRQIIEKHPGTLSDNYNVEFTGFGDSALLVLLNVYFENVGWSYEQAAKHTLHMAILKFANGIGVGFAFPSTTVMVEQFPNTGNDFPKYTADEDKVNKILQEITFDKK